MSGSALVDAHCHFDLFPNPREILQEAERNRIYSIAVTNTPSVFEPMRRLAEGLKYVRPALGLHPELALQRSSELGIFEREISKTRYVGEVGLDYKVVVKSADRAKQRAIFEEILGHCARLGGRILTVHSRRAETDVVAALREHRPGPFILHWYSGSLKALSAAIDAGAYFSVNAAMVRSERGQRLIRDMPRERVLTESDGPFVQAGGRSASPIGVRDTMTLLRQFWAVPRGEAEEQVLNNFHSLLRAGPVPRP